jgi:hypothetical protein
MDVWSIDLYNMSILSTQETKRQRTLWMQSFPPAIDAVLLDVIMYLNYQSLLNNN